MNTRANAGFLMDTLQKDTEPGKFQEQPAEVSVMTNDSLVTDGSCYFRADCLSAGPCLGTAGTVGDVNGD